MDTTAEAVMVNTTPHLSTVTTQGEAVIVDTVNSKPLFLVEVTDTVDLLPAVTTQVIVETTAEAVIVNTKPLLPAVRTLVAAVLVDKSAKAARVNSSSFTNPGRSCHS